MENKEQKEETINDFLKQLYKEAEDSTMHNPPFKKGVFQTIEKIEYWLSKKTATKK